MSNFILTYLAYEGYSLEQIDDDTKAQEYYELQKNNKYIDEVIWIKGEIHKQVRNEVEQ